jgi:ribosomal-protein-alanine N-acetyltransferase
MKMPRPVPTIASELVTLRAPDPVSDARDYFEMNREPDMHTWTGNRVLSSEHEARRELERYVAMDDVSTWMIVDNASHRVMGRFFLRLEERDGVRVAGEGNRIARRYWRKGHNRAARKLLFPYVFDVLAADLIETAAWFQNTNSIKSIESYGFRFDREEQQWNEKHGRQMAMRYYTMTNKQWRQMER